MGEVLKIYNQIQALPFEFRKRIKNEQVTVFENARWIYKKLLVSGTVRTIFSNNDAFTGDIYEEAVGTPTAEVYEHLVAANDYLYYIYIKHTGYNASNELTKTVNPIMVGIADASALAYNGTGVNRPLVAFPGESISLRFSGNADMKAQDIDIMTGKTINGYTLSANGAAGDRALVEIIALIRDVA